MNLIELMHQSFFGCVLLVLCYAGFNILLLDMFALSPSREVTRKSISSSENNRVIQAVRLSIIPAILFNAFLFYIFPLWLLVTVLVVGTLCQTCVLTRNKSIAQQMIHLNLPRWLMDIK